MRRIVAALQAAAMQAADRRDQEVLALLVEQRGAADGRAGVLRAEAEGKRNSEALSDAGSMLGGLLGIRKPAAPGVNAEAATQTGETAAAPAKAKPKTVEEELGGALSQGIGQLFGKKKKAPPVSRRGALG